MKNALLEPILASPNFPALLDALQSEWEQEQKRRHEFWAEVDENKKAEFVLGEVIYHSPVYGRHWMTSSNLCEALLPFVRTNKLGRVGFEKVMIRLTRNDYEPDVCFWTSEKARAFRNMQSAFPAPDMIVEIVSASTEHRDRGIKFLDYEQHGVQEYWIVDPERETVEQYLLEGGSYRLAVKIHEGSIRSGVITGFEIRLADLFSWESED